MSKTDGDQTSNFEVRLEERNRSLAVAVFCGRQIHAANASTRAVCARAVLPNRFAHRCVTHGSREGVFGDALIYDNSIAKQKAKQIKIALTNCK